MTFKWSDLTGGEDGIQAIARPDLPASRRLARIDSRTCSSSRRSSRSSRRTGHPEPAVEKYNHQQKKHCHCLVVHCVVHKKIAAGFCRQHADHSGSEAGTGHGQPGSRRRGFGFPFLQLKPTVERRRNWVQLGCGRRRRPLPLPHRRGARPIFDTDRRRSVGLHGQRRRADKARQIAPIAAGKGLVDLNPWICPGAEDRIVCKLSECPKNINTVFKHLQLHWPGSTFRLPTRWWTPPEEVAPENARQGWQH